jgi:hypothetical protein
MDAGKTTFPHERNKNKDLDDTTRLRTHTIGVLCYGFPIPALALVHDLTHYDNNANTIVTALHHTLQRNIEKIKQIREEKEKLQQITQHMSEEERQKYLKDFKTREKYTVW